MAAGGHRHRRGRGPSGPEDHAVAQRSSVGRGLKKAPAVSARTGPPGKGGGMRSRRSCRARITSSRENTGAPSSWGGAVNQQCMGRA